MPVQDNDPFFQATFMQEATSRADLIHNEFTARVQASLGTIKNVLTAPPGGPAEFDAYLIGSPATGAWAGAEGKIAIYLNGWKYLNPQAGYKLLVEQGPTGQDGRQIDYWLGGWSALGGSQALTAVDVGGDWTVSWDLQYGQVGRITLENPTTIFNKPINFRYGRGMTLIVTQDGAGGRAIDLKAGEWLTPGGTTPAPAAGSGASTAYTFQWLKPSDVGPSLIAVSSDLQITS